MRMSRAGTLCAFAHYRSSLFIAKKGCIWYWKQNAAARLQCKRHLFYLKIWGGGGGLFPACCLVQNQDWKPSLRKFLRFSFRGEHPFRYFLLNRAANSAVYCWQELVRFFLLSSSRILFGLFALYATFPFKLVVVLSFSHKSCIF